jgi:hypothetical protein
MRPGSGEGFRPGGSGREVQAGRFRWGAGGRSSAAAAFDDLQQDQRRFVQTQLNATDIRSELDGIRARGVPGMGQSAALDQFRARPEPRSPLMVEGLGLLQHAQTFIHGRSAQEEEALLSAVVLPAFQAACS